MKLKAIIQSREAYKLKCEELEARIADFQKANVQLENEIISLKNINSQLSLNASVSPVAQAPAVDILPYTAKISELEFIIEKLKKELISANEAVSQLRSQSFDSKAQAAVAAKLMAENVELRAQNTELTEKIAAITAEYDIEKDNELSMKVGKVLIEAQAGASRIIEDANSEVSKAKTEKNSIYDSASKEINALLAEINISKKYFQDISQSLSQKYESLDRLLVSAQSKFSNTTI
jgi:hypothetical protein